HPASADPLGRATRSRTTYGAARCPRRDRPGRAVCAGATGGPGLIQLACTALETPAGPSRERNGATAATGVGGGPGPLRYRSPARNPVRCLTHRLATPGERAPGPPHRVCVPAELSTTR